MSAAYYNEIDPDAVATLHELMRCDLIAPGHIDSRSIKEVEPDDLDGFTQCHFFAGAGIWSVAARLAGWPDARPLWTASCPCQPFSVIGEGAEENDPRHLWPDVLRLLTARRPIVVLGEQVAGAAGYRWFDGVASDLDREYYESRAVDIPLQCVDAPCIRQRLFWLAHDMGSSECEGLERQLRHGDGRSGRPQPDRSIASTNDSHGEVISFWAGAEWITCHDGKARRTEPSIRLLVDGMAGRIGLWRLAGNSISPVLAAEVLEALKEAA